jgi:hypothetical protein
MAAVGESVSAERRRVAEAGEGRRWKVFCSRNMPDVAFQLTREVADVDLWDGEDAPPHDVLLERLRDCDGFISLLTDRIDADLMDRCPRLKVITQLAVGFNNIDVAAATARGIYVTNTPDVLNVHPPPHPTHVVRSSSRQLQVLPPLYSVHDVVGAVVTYHTIGHLTLNNTRALSLSLAHLLLAFTRRPSWRPPLLCSSPWLVASWRQTSASSASSSCSRAAARTSPIHPQRAM